MVSGACAAPGIGFPVVVAVVVNVAGYQLKARSMLRENILSSQ